MTLIYKRHGKTCTIVIQTITGESARVLHTLTVFGEKLRIRKRDIMSIGA